MIKFNKKEKDFYIVSQDILPEAIKKTIVVKEMIKKGEADTINEAVAKVGLSRSAYYKYKDSVFPFYEASKQKIITVAMILANRPGVLSLVLNTIAEAQGNVLTINQGIPLQGVANVSVSIETAQLNIDTSDLILRMEDIRGVKKIEIIAQS